MRAGDGNGEGVARRGDTLVDTGHRRMSLTGLGNAGEGIPDPRPSPRSVVVSE